MKFQTKILVSVLVLAVSICAGQSHAQQMRRYIVTIQGPAAEAADAVMRAGGGVIHVYDIIPAIAIQIPQQALAGLERNPLIVAIEPDAVATTSVKPGKPQPPTTETLPWGVDRIDAEYAWPAGVTGDGVKVAVVDTGIDYTHPDLDGNYAGGTNIINSLKSPMDDNGHGTHVAGIIAAERGNNLGVVGVAPKASLYAVKVLDRTGSGYVSDIIAGLNWCVSHGIHIANMSLGTTVDVQSLHNACDNAWAAGVILVAAAGNDSGAVNYPAAYESVIAVSAVDSTDNLAYFSSRGPQVDFAAPGVNILSTYKGGGTKTLSGTSMAAPHVAGTMALAVQRVLASGGPWDAVAVAAAEAYVRDAADDLGSPGPDSLYGHGLVDAEQAATGFETGNN